ncbi:HlyD family efflux transporter periplasmic adaptor subunit [Shewanella sp. Isolate11]|uniref:HlyD family secretion protein n=1 Tax=Shewanella sp. Isolate11 TaxID=2908530 RepID=UPI001EFEA2D6|nr:HlyD family efflux transporter periplasmic adaptor subunit [Shewanella sp. Isolate11]MCG9695514.1 HlyD family efflux transporter periplasmic adaptor subunit [Shewanella sp. Isolate11]
MNRSINSVLLFFVCTLSISACQPEVTNQALGTLERDRVLLRATAGELITQLPKKEGSHVEQGELLLQLDNRKQSSRVAIAKADLAQAQAYLLRLTNGERPEDIASAQANVQRSTAAMVQAEKAYQRINSLKKQNLVSQSDLDDAIANRDRTIAEHNAANESLAKLIVGVRQEDITQAQASLDAAKAKLALEQQTLDDLSIIATRSGRLDSLPFNLGERVPTNAVVVVIQADNAPYARVYIPEPYVAKLAIGQQLKVYVDGVDKAFVGQLRWLSKEPAFTPYYALNQQDRSRLVYLAEFDLEKGAAQLATGLPAQVELPQ